MSEEKKTFINHCIVHLNRVVEMPKDPALIQVLENVFDWANRVGLNGHRATNFALDTSPYDIFNPTKSNKITCKLELNHKIDINYSKNKEWISVKDKPPEDGQEVWIRVWSEPENKEVEVRSKFTLIYIDENNEAWSWAIKKELGITARPTHWKPYTEEKNN